LSGRVARYARAGWRLARVLASGRPAAGVRVYYGLDRVPAAGEPATGGSAKLQRLSTRFPNAPNDFTLLYLSSNQLPPLDLRPLLWASRRRRAPIVLNQDGVGYPAWAGERTDEINRRLRVPLHAADHVLYQSEFCKATADRFVGEPSGSWEVLPNAVDLERFTPVAEPPADGPLLLLAGDQTQAPYRVELALRTLALLRARFPDARLLVTGKLGEPVDTLLAELDLGGSVDLLGRYAQRDAPGIFRRAHLLLHTQVNDACPSIVLEAMACGLPVVHPASGGTVELVGDEGGIGVPHPESFERMVPPLPEAMAAAVTKVLDDLGTWRRAARRRAQRFELGAWLDRHDELFSSLVGRRPPTR
jgi:glycosyltransferase involved in cell wall biosynthesis